VEGYDVTVIFAQHAEWSRASDAEILARSSWRGIAIVATDTGFLPRLARFTIRVRSIIFRALARMSTIAPILELASSRYFIEQTWRAISSRSDLYIGHNPPSLPVVAWAARINGAKYGFDFEDFHMGEIPIDQGPGPRERLLKALEDRYLPGASYVTAASPGIAAEVHKLHKSVKPVTVLNAFPWTDRSRLPIADRTTPRTKPLSLYWFSQIVGLDRGLQDVVRALGLVKSPAVLHIRGATTRYSAREAKLRLLKIAHDSGSNKKIFFHDPIPPQDLLASCAEHDVGLCLESPISINRDVCITNKLFLYMLGNLAIVASRTQGQAEMLTTAPGIGFLYEPGNDDELASIIERLAQDPALLERTRTRALEAAGDRWNWELESRVLVSTVKQVSAA
jgi:glycosyltransferase involved in cell wall biosynthesis